MEKTTIPPPSYRDVKDEEVLAAEAALASEESASAPPFTYEEHRNTQNQLTEYATMIKTLEKQLKVYKDQEERLKEQAFYQTQEEMRMKSELKKLESLKEELNHRKTEYEKKESKVALYIASQEKERNRLSELKQELHRMDIELQKQQKRLKNQQDDLEYRKKRFDKHKQFYKQKQINTSTTSATNGLVYDSEFKVWCRP